MSSYFFLSEQATSSILFGLFIFFNETEKTRSPADS